MSYPNYPPYPAPTGNYGWTPPSQPGYPNQPSFNPGYPSGPATSYPPYPSSDTSYPSFPSQNSQYPHPGSLPYPVQPAQPFYSAQPTNYPHQYNPTAPPQASYPGVQPAFSNQHPSAPVAGLYPSAAPGLPPVNYRQQPMEQNIPTVYPASPFDPRADADVLHKAMKGLGTDEKALINILCRRTSGQRSAISLAYKSGYGKDLESKLKSELSGCFEKVMVALCLPMAEFMARQMNDAVRGLGTNDGTLIEILCSGTNQEIREMNAAYLRLYGHPMEKDIKGDTSGTFKMLLVSLTQGQRDENPMVDIHKCKEDAQRLFHAGEARLGTDESTFNSILATRSWSHLRQLMYEYQSQCGHSLEKAVANEFSANAEKGLLTILQCAQNRSGYFAQRLHDAIKGWGTKDANLIRIIVSRCDIDLGNIKQEYERKFGRSLAADVTGDTSGDYKKALLTLLG